MLRKPREIMCHSDAHLLMETILPSISQQKWMKTHSNFEFYTKKHTTRQLPYYAHMQDVLREGGLLTQH